MGVTSSRFCFQPSGKQGAGATASEVRVSWTQRHSLTKLDPSGPMRIQYLSLAFYVTGMGMGKILTSRNASVIALWIGRLRLRTLPIQWTLAFERDQNCESRPGASTYGKIWHPIISYNFFDKVLTLSLFLWLQKISKSNAASVAKEETLTNRAARVPKCQNASATRRLNVRRPHRDRERSLLCWTRWEKNWVMEEVLVRKCSHQNPKYESSHSVWIHKVRDSQHCSEASFGSWLDPYSIHCWYGADTGWAGRAKKRLEPGWISKEMNIRKKSERTWKNITMIWNPIGIIVTIVTISFLGLRGKTDHGANPCCKGFRKSCSESKLESVRVSGGHLCLWNPSLTPNMNFHENHEVEPLFGLSLLKCIENTLRCINLSDMGPFSHMGRS